MNPMLQAFLTSVFRWVLTLGAGWLVSHGVLAQSEAQAYVAAGAVALVTLVWGLWDKYHARVKFLTALQLDRGATESDVKEIIKEGNGATMKDTTKVLVFLLLVSPLAGCGVIARATPPNLTPEAVKAYHNTQIIQGLDILRDGAIQGNALMPPAVSTETTRLIVQYHESSILIINAIPDGWIQTVGQGLVELSKRIPPRDRATLGPYLTLLGALLREVQ